MPMPCNFETKSIKAKICDDCAGDDSRDEETIEQLLWDGIENNGAIIKSEEAFYE